MDIRLALESYEDMASAAAYLSDISKHYAYNHLVLMSDRFGGGVLENNFSGTGTAMRRALRRDTSELNPGIEWEYPGAVAAVNSFVLSGNHDNHTGVQFNTGRWSSFRSQVGLGGGQVDWEELKIIAGFDNGNGPGYEYTDIYNAGNHQIVCFRPDSMVLEAAFKPRSGILPDDPIFHRVTLAFDSSTGVAEHHPQAERTAIKIYPNPCRGLAWVSLIGQGEGIGDIHLYDVAGRRVRTLPRPTLFGHRAEVALDLKGLAQGVYLLREGGGSGGRSVKLVKVE